MPIKKHGRFSEHEDMTVGKMKETNSIENKFTVQW